MTQPAPALRALLTTLSLALAGVAIATASPASADPPGQVLDQAVFDQLKALAGRWEGRVDDATGTPVALEMAVTSNGHAVLERVFAGSPHEMTTVYFLANDRLLATHYCSIGNQPGFALADTSKPTDIVMELAGGTGFDPKTDQHAHGVHLQVIGPDRLRVEWQFRKGDADPTYTRMTLSRTPVVPP
jgi:hypothetical protein